MRASESNRALICPASLVLPRTPRTSAKRDDAAAFGTFVHYWAETGDSEPEWASESHKKTFRKKLAMTLIDRNDWWPDGEGQHEVPFALHLLTLQVLRYSGQRDGGDAWKKAFNSEWLTGTVDWVGTKDGWTWVDDLKTGAWPVDAATSGQLRSYALPVWVEEGCPAEWNAYLSITQWPKYKLDGEPVRTGVWVTGFDMREHLDALRWASEHPEEVTASEEGCMFCECKPLCPAHIDDNVSMEDL